MQASWQAARSSQLRCGARPSSWSRPGGEHWRTAWRLQPSLEHALQERWERSLIVRAEWAPVSARSLEGRDLVQKVLRPLAPPGGSRQLTAGP